MFFLLMVRVSGEAGFGFFSACENCRYWLFMHLAHKLLKKHEQCLCINEWMKAAQFALLIASGYLFENKLF